MIACIFNMGMDGSGLVQLTMIRTDNRLRNAPFSRALESHNCSATARSSTKSRISPCANNRSLRDPLPYTDSHDYKFSAIATSKMMSLSNLTVIRVQAQGFHLMLVMRACYFGGTEVINGMIVVERSTLVKP